MVGYWCAGKVLRPARVESTGYEIRAKYRRYKFDLIASQASATSRHAIAGF
jgi:hypothetical protein